MRQIGSYFLALLFSGGTVGVLVSLVGRAKHSSARDRSDTSATPPPANALPQQQSPQPSLATDPREAVAPRQLRQVKPRTQAGGKGKRAAAPTG